MTNKREMWHLHRLAETTSQRPSDIIGIADRWTAYQFDSAVTLVGTVIDNASQEREQVGSEPNRQWIDKYTMDQLLTPEFRLPSSAPGMAGDGSAIAKLKMMAAQRRGVKVFKAKDS